MMDKFSYIQMIDRALIQCSQIFIYAMRKWANDKRKNLFLKQKLYVELSVNEFVSREGKLHYINIHLYLILGVQNKAKSCTESPVRTR